MINKDLTIRIKEGRSNVRRKSEKLLEMELDYGLDSLRIARHRKKFMGKTVYDIVLSLAYTLVKLIFSIFMKVVMMFVIICVAVYSVVNINSNSGVAIQANVSHSNIAVEIDEDVQEVIYDGGDRNAVIDFMSWIYEKLKGLFNRGDNEVPINIIGKVGMIV